MTSPTTTDRLGAIRDAAGDIPLEQAEVVAHLRRFDATYVAEVAPRSVVRHLLMLRRPPRPGEVASRVTPSPHADERRRELDVVTIDTSGLFSRICGVVSLAGGDVVGAQAHTTGDGVAVDTVEVTAPNGVATSWWARFEGDLVDAVAGRIALRPRVDRMAREVGGPGDRHVEVTVGDGEAGQEVRIRTADRLGLLFAITDAMADLRLDIRTAVIKTHGGMASDRFVVRGADGGELDRDQASQVAVAVRWAVDRLGA